jgi:cytochrome c-type biogenesis protein CcmH/NrfG
MTSPVLRLLAAVVLLALFAVVALRRPTSKPDDRSNIWRCETERSSDIGVLEHCLALQPDNIEVMLDLGDAYRRTARLADSEAVYRRALAIDPRDAELHQRLSDVLLLQGNRAAALLEAERVAEIRPGQAE